MPALTLVAAAGSGVGDAGGLLAQLPEPALRGLVVRELVAGRHPRPAAPLEEAVGTAVRRARAGRRSPPSASATRPARRCWARPALIAPSRIEATPAGRRGRTARWPPGASTAKPGWAASAFTGSSGAAQPPVELVGEEQVGELGLPVRRPRLVAPVLHARVAQRRRARDPVHLRGDRDDRGRPRDATSCGSSSPVSRNGPKWLVAICSSRPSAVRWYGVPITPALLTSTSIGPSRGRGRGRPAYRRQVGEVELEPLERRRPGTSAQDRARSVSASRSGERPVSTTRAPRRASSSAVWWPSPPTVVPVTTTVRPAWSGMSAEVPAVRAGHGVVASASMMRPAERLVAGDGERARLGLAAAAGQPDERLAVHPQRHRRRRRARRPAARRGRASLTANANGVAALELEHRRGARPARRRCLAEHEAQALGEVLRRVPRRRASPCRPGGRPRGGCPARASTRRAAGCAAACASPTARRRRSARAWRRASVGGSASSAVCRAVAAARISLMIASGLASRRVTTPISV